nr:MAG TPA: hypothetical protein [Caudoviricetes sp.]
MSHENATFLSHSRFVYTNPLIGWFFWFITSYKSYKPYNHPLNPRNYVS